MSALFAFLGDSFREAMDRRSLFILVVLSGLVILACASVSFEEEAPATTLASQAGRLGDAPAKTPFGGIFSSMDARVTVREIAESAAAGWPEDVRGGPQVGLEFASATDLDALARRWRERTGKPSGGDGARSPLDGAARAAFLEERFRAFGYEHAKARELAADPPRYEVAVRTDHPRDVAEARGVWFAFRLWKIPLPGGIPIADLVVGIEYMLADVFAGFIGMLIAVVVCSSFVPSLLQKGTADLVLARPLSRPAILLGKYLGGVAFVFALACLLIGGCWAALSLRTGYASPWFLATVLTITASFAVLHAVSVLIGVLTRSAGVSSLLALGVWGLSTSIDAGRRLVQVLSHDREVSPLVQKALNVAYAVVPKMKDIGALNAVFLSRSYRTASGVRSDLEQRIAEALKVDWGFSLGTTAAFTVVVLALAVWRFRQRDF